MAPAMREAPVQAEQRDVRLDLLLAIGGRLAEGLLGHVNGHVLGEHRAHVVHRVSELGDFGRVVGVGLDAQQ
eukprot:1681014-Pleurochrysis_carterae.AAC.1